MLTTLLLVKEGVLLQPLLYLSLYLEQHRSTYYELLQRVRMEGDWEPRRALSSRWTRPEGCPTCSRKTGGASGVRAACAPCSPQHPIQTVRTAAQRSKVSVPTATKAMDELERAGVVWELTGKARNRVYAYDRYLAVLNEGTDLAN